MNNKSSVLKVGVVYTLSNIVIKGMAFLTTPFFSRILSQSEYGQFSNISSWISILITIVTLDLYSSVSVAKYDYDENIDQYMSSVMLFGNIVTLLFYGLFELHIAWFEDFFGVGRDYIRIMCMYFLFYPSVQIMLAKYRIYNDYQNVLKITWVNTFVSFLAQIVLVLVFEDKLLGRFLGNYASAALFGFILWAVIIVRGRSFSSRYYKHALKLAVPLIPHVLSGVLLASFDRVMINSICGSEEAGFYSLAYTISTIAGVILTSLNQAWIPWMFDRMETEREQIKTMMKPYALLFLLFCIALMLFGPEAVLIFGGASYFSSRFVIPPVIYALMLQFVYMQYVNIEFYYRKNVYISIATILAAGINIVLNFLLLPKYGYIMAAYTTIIGYLVMAIAHFIIVRQVIGESSLYDGQFFIRIILFLGVIMAVCLISYNILVLRIMLIAFFMVLGISWIVKNKNKFHLKGIV